MNTLIPQREKREVHRQPNPPDIPPIVIDGKAKASLNVHLDEITSGDYSLKINANQMVYTNMADYQAVSRNLQDEDSHSPVLSE